MLVRGAIAALVVALLLTWGVRRARVRPPAGITGLFSSVGQIRTGDKVFYRGVKIGKVQEIRLSPGQDGVFVEMEVLPDLRFPPDVGVLIEPSALLGSWQAEVVSRSWHPELQFAIPRQAGAVLPGATLTDLTALTAAASHLEAVIDTVKRGFTPAKIAEIHATVDRAQTLSEQLRGLLGAQGQTYDKTGHGVLASSQGIAAMSRSAATQAAAMRDSLHGGSVADMLASARVASQNLDLVAARLGVQGAAMRARMAGADSSLGAIQRVAEGMNGTLRAMGPRAAQAGALLENAQRAMRTLDAAMSGMQNDTSALGRLISDPAQYQNALKAVSDLRLMLDDLQAHPERYIGSNRRR
jgi:ABC-type transporter Mla subunit MlaD